MAKIRGKKDTRTAMKRRLGFIVGGIKETLLQDISDSVIELRFEGTNLEIEKDRSKDQPKTTRNYGRGAGLREEIGSIEAWSIYTFPTSKCDHTWRKGGWSGAEILGEPTGLFSPSQQDAGILKVILAVIGEKPESQPCFVVQYI